MSRRPRRNHSPSFKAKVALAAIKYEEVNLRAYTNDPEARAGIGRHIQLFNATRPHSSLDGRTPDEAYCK